MYFIHIILSGVELGFEGVTLEFPVYTIYNVFSKGGRDV